MISTLTTCLAGPGRALVLGTMSGLCLLGASPSAAVAADVGYVASLVGDAEVEVERKRSELSFLDFLPDGSRLHIAGGSEIRVCHSAAGAISSVSGPAVVRVTGRELISETGKPPVSTGERCNAPLVSKTQGGTAFRSIGGQPLAIGVRSWLRVVPASKTGISKATLLSPDEKTPISEFRTISVSPVVLSAGSVYPLVVQFSDGRKLTVRLAAREGIAADVAVINVSP